MIVYEAFTPSGTEAPDTSAGLFSGEPEHIKNLVAARSSWCQSHQVSLIERPVRVVGPEDAKLVLSALAEADAARNKLRALGVQI